MRREAFHFLEKWYKKQKPIPLLVRGARQVGKSYLVTQFGKEVASSFVAINFELQPDYKVCFESLYPEEILEKIRLLSGKQIIPGETLLFFDEIQACPEAIESLRYFKEKLPQQHVIGAGSLLEFALHGKGFHMPVGRVHYLYLRPMSFQENLDAMGKQHLNKYLAQITLEEKIPKPLHQQCLDDVKRYLIVGGMPASVANYIAEDDLVETQLIQSNILNTYQSDFSKYAAQTNYKYLQVVFKQAPNLIGQNIKYAKIDSDMKARDLKIALQDLVYANVITPVHLTKASGIPLNATEDTKRFRLLFLDVGLVTQTLRVAPNIILEGETMLLNQGRLTEQFVGQELLAYDNPLLESQLYFWQREQRTAKAEVDYVMQYNQHIIPIEVKAGSKKQMKSLYLFMQEKNSPIGIKISQDEFALDGKLLKIPFYMIKQIPRLLKDLLD